MSLSENPKPDVLGGGIGVVPRQHRIDHEPDDEPELRFWCPPCAEREFAAG
jgi:hypothetical protein